MKFWITGVASPRGSARTAARIEEAGWDGFLVVDSQNLSGDPYVALAMAATTTSVLGLGTGVTNCVTRHAAATACAIASVDRVSGGRAVLGIGRGDSALAHLGRAPAKPAVFARYLRQLQAYLRGEAVPFEEIDIPPGVAPPLAGLELADAPPASRIDWIGAGRKVEVEAAASGPTVIAIAARHADRVMFALGADEERIAWGIETAREARRKAGLDPDGMRFGAYLNVGCNPDIEVARSLVKGGLTTFARFSVMHGKASGPVSETDRAVLHDLRHAYDMKAHTRGDSAQAAVLTPDFIDRFAVTGTPEQCISRLKGLAALGLDRVAITGALRGVSETDAATSRRLLETEVLPALR
ncbi:LLM class flavin-dependent oxidoreductase [Rhodopila sp.]|uniref:LLM class flavin-dependent oxidoreductase n=1 Tax=Rhodopila sp. TaxID=2480087 RepID=UPI002CF8B06C|nr:LLM class flavin-dependent oxidoreductase [Rhodopila sp.]HVZ10750.1 LLM class flavin-dependent oxidoreductase [Rhodopila sp.]